LAERGAMPGTYVRWLLKTAPVAVSAVASEAIWRRRWAGSSLGLNGSSRLFFLDTSSGPAGFRFRFFTSGAAAGPRWILKKSTILVWTSGNSANRTPPNSAHGHRSFRGREGESVGRTGYSRLGAGEDLEEGGGRERQASQNQSPAGTRGRTGRRQKVW
jgi:hypothetical protein